MMMTGLSDSIQGGHAMIRAVLSKGVIRPLESLPADWPEGQSNAFGEYRTPRGSKCGSRSGLLELAHGQPSK